MLECVLVLFLLVPLLEFVVPAIEVDVEDDHRTGGQTSHKEPI